MSIVREMDITTELNKAEHAREVRRPDLAIEIAQRVLAVAPDTARALTIIALAYSDKKEHDRAISTMKEVLRLSPNNGYYHALHGRFLTQMGRLKEAEEALKRGLSLAPYNSTIYNWYANLLLYYKKNVDEALVYLEKALAIDPTEVTNHIMMGTAREKKGEHQKAEAAFQEALRLQPNGSAPHHHYGLYLLNRNKPKEAFVHLREAIRVNPENEEIRKHFLLALKAKNWVYGMFWTYSLWMQKRGLRFGVLAVIIISYNLIRIATQNHDLVPYISIVIGCFWLSILFIKVVDPVFNFFIRRGWMK